MNLDNKIIQPRQASHLFVFNDDSVDPASTLSTGLSRESH